MEIIVQQLQRRIRILETAFCQLEDGVSIRDCSNGTVLFENRRQKMAKGLNRIIPFSLNDDNTGGEGHFELCLNEAQMRKELRMVLDTLCHIIFYTDEHGQVEYVNTSGLEYCGIEPDQCLGSSWLNLIHPDDFERTSKAWVEHVQLGKDYCHEYRLMGNDGTYRWFSVRSKPMKDSNGRIIRWYGTCTDIHDKKLYEEKYLSALAQQQKEAKLLETILQQLPLGIAVGEPSGNFCYKNSAIPKLVAPLLSGSLRNFECYCYDTGKSYDSQNWPISRCLLNGETVSTERIVIVGKNDQVCVINTSAKPIHDGNEKVEMGVILFDDVTDRLKMEEDRLQSLAREKAATEASELKSLFLAHMSHEIRTPLNGIVSMTEILMEDSTLCQKSKDFISTIQICSTSLLSIVNDILDLSKIETGRFELERAPFNLKKLLNNVEKISSINAMKKNIELEFTFTGYSNLQYIGDEQRLHQVLLNLIGNAIKFTPSYKKVFVNTETRKRNDENICDLQITVEDEGIGMSEQTLSGLYTPFHQADLSNTRIHGGTGLGLSICKRIIVQMNGSINVQSELGNGTKFTINLSLPLVSKRPSPSTTPPPSLNEAQSFNKDIRILVAEDNLVNQQVIARILDRYGYKNLIIVDNGRKAVDKYRELNGAFDIVFMDCQMPMLDGLQATRLIREYETSKRAKHTAIVALTAGALKTDRMACLESGMDEHISKPFTPKQIMEVIRRTVFLK